MIDLTQLTRFALLADKLAVTGKLAQAVEDAQGALDAYLDENADVAALLDELEATKNGVVLPPEPVLPPPAPVKTLKKGARPRGVMRFSRKNRPCRTDFDDGIMRRQYRGAFYVTVAGEVGMGLVESLTVPMRDGTRAKRRVVWLSDDEVPLIRQECAERKAAAKAAKGGAV